MASNPEPVGHLADRVDVPVRQGPDHLQVRGGLDQGLTGQGSPQRLDRVFGQGGQVRQGLVLDLRTLPEGTAQQHGLVLDRFPGLVHPPRLRPGYMNRLLRLRHTTTLKDEERKQRQTRHKFSGYK